MAVLELVLKQMNSLGICHEWFGVAEDGRYPVPDEESAFVQWVKVGLGLGLGLVNGYFLALIREDLWSQVCVAPTVPGEVRKLCHSFKLEMDSGSRDIQDLGVHK